MRRPSVEDLDSAASCAAIEIATKLGSHGQRAWLVGGTVRDLALGRPTKDVDMASAARPETIESIFEKTVSVGRAFGTVIVLVRGMEVQLTTFRSEEGYSDGRRPDRVAYGDSAEIDARRRDFTCNALYLDPLNDELLDPTGGIADLERGVLRCVGDPAQRFAEDGLRLLRLARLAGALDLEPAPEVRAAARAAGETLRGVSAERRLNELARILSEPGSRRAIGLFFELELAGRVLPEPAGLASIAEGAQRLRSWRRDLLQALPAPPGVALGLAALCDPHPGAAGFESLERPTRADFGQCLVASLRPSRELERELWSLWGLRAAIERQLEVGQHKAARAERLRLFREPAFDQGLVLACAVAAAAGRSQEAYAELARERAALSEEELSPEPFVQSADLERLGVAPGPRWGELLAEAERRQLEGEFADRAAALEWLQRAL